MSRPEVAPTAQKVDWRRASAARNPEVKRAAHRYGVINALVAAGVDVTHVDVYYDDDEQGVYWVVDPGRGRSAVLTDDTESYAGWLEGPWPFVARFTNADAVVEVVDHSIDALVTRAVEWVTTA